MKTLIMMAMMIMMTMMTTMMMLTTLIYSYNDDRDKAMTYCRSEKEATFVLDEMRANVENVANLEEKNSRQREISVPDPSPRRSNTSSVHNNIKVFLPLLLIIFI